jgi:hypothetical protein
VTRSRSEFSQLPKAWRAKPGHRKGQGEFYEEAKRGRSASHQIQVKAALSLLYKVIFSLNPFAECLAPKFAPGENRAALPQPFAAKFLRGIENLAGRKSE